MTLLSDIGGFMGTLQAFTGIFMNFIYLPIVSETSLLRDLFEIDIKPNEKPAIMKKLKSKRSFKIEQEDFIEIFK